MKSLTLFSVLFLLATLDLIGQTCYIQKLDASGIDVTPYQNDLNAAACELQSSFPSEFQNSFKVFGYGYYRILTSVNEDQNSLPSFEASKVQAQAESDYYLLIGKQSTDAGIYLKFWVDVKLPETGDFACLTESFRLLITEKVRQAIESNYDARGRFYPEYAQAEMAGMQELERIVNNIKNGQCCEFGAKEILDVLADLDFVGFPCVIYDQPAFRPNSSQGQGRSPIEITDHAQLNFEIQEVFINTNQVLFDLLTNLSVQGYIGKGFITKNENFCDNNKFDDVKDSYQADLSDYDIWYHIWDNPVAGEEDIVFIKSEKFDEIQEAVNVTSLPVNDGNFEWLDKTTLRNYV
ncbi:MAG: hypothetical protein R2828_14360 [Saprospiraceae bacterium]